MIKHLFAFITRRPLVWLRDHDGTVTLTVAKRTPWGDLVAERCWPFSIRSVTLGEGGKVLGTSYVQDWKFYKEPQP